MKILTFSTLYPHAARPSHGFFLETPLRHMLANGQVESRVVAPVPLFPSRNAWFGDYSAHAMAPHEERRHGIQVLLIKLWQGLRLPLANRIGPLSARNLGYSPSPFPDRCP